MFSPIYQGIFTILLNIFVIFLLRKKHYETIINVSAFILGIFALFNSILGIFLKENWGFYVLKSIFVYIFLLIFMMFFLEKSKKMLNIQGSGEGIMIFLAHIIYYPIILLIILIIRWLKN